MIKVNSTVDLRLVKEPDEIANSDSPKGKPFIVITFPDGTKQAITTNIAEMIGGAGAGMRKAREELEQAQRIPQPGDVDYLPFTPAGQEERLEDYPPVTGQSVSCTKCGLKASSMLHRFCQHKICPARRPM